MATGYAYHPLFLWRDTGTSAALIPATPMAGVQPATHLEHPEFKRRAHELLHVSGLLRELMIIEPWSHTSGPSSSRPPNSCPPSRPPHRHSPRTDPTAHQPHPAAPHPTRRKSS